MSTLPITKQDEAKAVVIIWNMGCHSLDPCNYAKLEESLRALCLNRNIDNEVVAGYQVELSRKIHHCSDCETSTSPAFLPGPCDCDC